MNEPRNDDLLKNIIDRLDQFEQVRLQSLLKEDKRSFFWLESFTVANLETRTITVNENFDYYTIIISPSNVSSILKVSFGTTINSNSMITFVSKGTIRLPALNNSVTFNNTTATNNVTLIAHTKDYDILANLT